MWKSLVLLASNSLGFIGRIVVPSPLYYATIVMGEAHDQLWPITKKCKYYMLIPA